MYASYLYPGYRGWINPVPVWGYPTWGYSGYGGYGGYGGYYGSNIVGSAIATNYVANTGTISGISQIANPVAIW